jgi:hypothetical protein
MTNRKKSVSAMRVRLLISAALVLAMAACLGLGCKPAASTGASTEHGASVASGKTSSDDNLAVALEWSKDADCSICHTTEYESRTDQNTQAVSHANLECMKCHTDDTKLAKAHKGASTESKAPGMLKRTQMDPEVCGSCHRADELAATTANRDALVDDKGTVVNPHALPASEQHDTIGCGSCHKMHKDSSSMTNNAKAACASCHHAGVFECHTCHK